MVNEVVRGQNVYIIQTAGAGRPHDHLMEVLFMVNACRYTNSTIAQYQKAQNQENVSKLKEFFLQKLKDDVISVQSHWRKVL